MKQRYEQGEYRLFYQKRGDARADERDYLTENRLSAFVLALEYEKLIRNVRERNGGDLRYDVYDERPPPHVFRHSGQIDKRVIDDIVDERGEKPEHDIKHYFFMLFDPFVRLFSENEINNAEQKQNRARDCKPRADTYAEYRFR